MLLTTYKLKQFLKGIAGYPAHSEFNDFKIIQLHFGSKEVFFKYGFKGWYWVMVFMICISAGYFCYDSEKTVFIFSGGICQFP